MFQKKSTLFLLLILSGLTFSSCSNYQKLLRSDDVNKKYTASDSLYKIGKYKKALGLMEQIVPAFRGKPQAQPLMFRYANTFYELEDYVLAGYQFERFVTSYPKSDSAEIAAYRSARSYYELSPRYSLDQKETFTALEKLQLFVDKFPASEYRKEANTMANTLKEKLEEKDIKTALQYLKISDFKASIAALDNFIVDHPGSKYKEEAYFKRIEAAYTLAINSLPWLVEERLLDAKKFYEAYLKYFSNGSLRQEADEYYTNINERLTKINSEIN